MPNSVDNNEPDFAGMSAFALAHFLRRIRLAEDVAALIAAAQEIESRFPGDEATPVLQRVIRRKVTRLAEAN